jgi:hypothetical protein
MVHDGYDMWLMKLRLQLRPVYAIYIRHPTTVSISPRAMTPTKQS